MHTISMPVGWAMAPCKCTLVFYSYLSGEYVYVLEAHLLPRLFASNDTFPYHYGRSRFARDLSRKHNCYYRCLKRGATNSKILAKKSWTSLHASGLLIFLRSIIESI